MPVIFYHEKQMLDARRANRTTENSPKGCIDVSHLMCYNY